MIRKTHLAFILAASLAVVAVVGIRTWSDAREKPPVTAKAGASDGGVPTPPAGKTFRILHVMSYHTPWKWTADQLTGFRDALGGLDVDYRVFQLDAKRRSTPQWLSQAGAEALRQIEQWQPDLVFTGDDAAQAHVGKALVNTDIPVVFCAVNADPADYGYVGSRNVTGVLEREHFLETVGLLKRLVPSVRRIAIISDRGDMWKRVIRRIEAGAPELEDVQLVTCDVIETFAQYKDTVLRLQNEVDAIGFLGVFEFTDDAGNNVPLEEVTRWTVAHSRLPDFSFWEDRIPKGTLCAVTVSGYEQGFDAGQLARSILSRGRSPAGYAIRPTVRGDPVISLARAKALGIMPSAEVLLACKVITEFDWGD